MKPSTKRIISILLGVGTVVLSLCIAIAFLFSAQRDVLGNLLLAADAGILLFLVLWNKITSKKKYLPLIVPLICIAVGTAIVMYEQYSAEIPTVEEKSRYPYTLASLDEEVALKITANPPVLDGATALYDVYVAFAKAVYPPDIRKNIVLNSKTAAAYTNLLERRADIIFCATHPAFQQRNPRLSSREKIEFLS